MSQSLSKQNNTIEPTINYVYESEFKQAFKSTLELGFLSESIVLNERKLISKNLEKAGSLVREIMETIFNQNLVEEHLKYLIKDADLYKKLPKKKTDPNYYNIALCNNCLNIHLYALGLVKKYFDCNAYLTLGYYREDILGKNIYEFSVSDFKNWLQRGNLSFYGFDFHAWITLDTLEIFDLTLMTTMGFHLDREDLIGQVYHHSPKDIAQIDKRSYHPIVVCTDELIKELIKSL